MNKLDMLLTTKDGEVQGVTVMNGRQEKKVEVAWTTKVVIDGVTYRKFIFAISDKDAK